MRATIVQRLPSPRITAASPSSRRGGPAMAMNGLPCPATMRSVPGAGGVARIFSSAE
jgi:hypothetical protein